MSKIVKVIELGMNFSDVAETYALENDANFSVDLSNYGLDVLQVGGAQYGGGSENLSSALAYALRQPAIDLADQDVGEETQAVLESLEKNAQKYGGMDA